MIQWSPQYSVGFKMIDRQHQEFFGAFNELYDAFLQKKGSAVLEGVLSQLSNYAEYHFATEERYFREFGYEGAKEHIFQHDMFRNQIAEFNKHFHREHDLDQLAAELVELLDVWLVKHVVEMDRKYADCFRKHGLE